jgi:NADPH:quinone reductase-like Zn-dependent oxidoreductase
LSNHFINILVFHSIISGQLGADFTDRVIGSEFAGRRSDTGERVIGITTGKSIATSIDINPNLLINIPEKWSLEEGASVISGYFTVWYSLINRAQLEEGLSQFKNTTSRQFRQN